MIVFTTTPRALASGWCESSADTKKAKVSFHKTCKGHYEAQLILADYSLGKTGSSPSLQKHSDDIFNFCLCVANKFAVQSTANENCEFSVTDAIPWEKLEIAWQKTCGRMKWSSNQ